MEGNELSVILKWLSVNQLHKRVGGKVSVKIGYQPRRFAGWQISTTIHL